MTDAGARAKVKARLCEAEKRKLGPSRGEPQPVCLCGHKPEHHIYDTGEFLECLRRDCQCSRYVKR